MDTLIVDVRHEVALGKTVRINQDWTLRRFLPIPRRPKQFERLYKRSSESTHA